MRSKAWYNLKKYNIEQVQLNKCNGIEEIEYEYNLSQIEKNYYKRGDVETCTNLRFCNRCDAQSNINHYRWHFCSNNKSLIGVGCRVFYRRDDIAVRNIKNTMIYVSITFRKILGKDVTKIIVNMLFETRYDIHLWYRKNKEGRIKKWKNKEKTQKYIRRMRDIKFQQDHLLHYEEQHHEQLL